MHFFAFLLFFFFQAEDGIRDTSVTGVQTCALPISLELPVLVSVSDWVELLPTCTLPKLMVEEVACSTLGGLTRSEERRVGKECRSRWSPHHEKKKKKKRYGHNGNK